MQIFAIRAEQDSQTDVHHLEIYMKAIKGGRYCDTGGEERRLGLWFLKQEIDGTYLWIPCDSGFAWGEYGRRR